MGSQIQLLSLSYLQMQEKIQSILGSSTQKMPPDPPPAPDIGLGFAIESYSWEIYNDSSGTYYAKSGSNGTNCFPSTNSSWVIQQAFNSLTPNRTWKERVVLRGCITISYTLYIPSYTILDIDGILKEANGMNTWLIIPQYNTPDGTIYVEIENGIIDFNGANNQGTASQGLGLTGLAYSLIQNVHFKNNYGYGCLWSGGVGAVHTSDQNTIQNCFFEGGYATHGYLEIGDGASWNINNNIFINGQNGALSIAFMTNSTICHNILYNLQYMGIYMEASQYVDISHNIIWHVGQSGANKDGISIGASEFYPTPPFINIGIKVNDNLINNTGYYGIRFYDTQYGQVKNNIIIDPTASGICSYSTAGDRQVIGNEYSGNTIVYILHNPNMGGIILYSNVAGTNCLRNKIFDNYIDMKSSVQRGIDMDREDYNEIYDNTVLNCGNWPYVRYTGSNSLSRNNRGFNPTGLQITTPSMPASDTYQQNTFGYPIRIYILTVGSVTSYTIKDVWGTTQTITTSLSAGMEITLDPLESIAFHYTSAPTWKWYGA
jgi:hypothetical protein